MTVKVPRHLCLECGARRARFRYRGAVKTDVDHTLCFECHRALQNSLREIAPAIVLPALNSEGAILRLKVAAA